MQNYSKEISDLCDKCLSTADIYKEYTDEDLMNATEIFVEGFIAKLWDRQEAIKMPMKKRESQATEAGNALRQLIIKYTDIDLHKIYGKK